MVFSGKNLHGGKFPSKNLFRWPMRHWRNARWQGSGDLVGWLVNQEKTRKKKNQQTKLVNLKDLGG